jgi:single-strand DNA-binding protein
MLGVNKAVLVGHVGKDPELKNLGNGKTKVSFSVATSESWKDKNSGDRKERTAWHQIVIFDETLVRVAEHQVKKGSKVYVEGKILYRTWEDAGQKKYITEIVIDGFNSRLEILDRSAGEHVPESESMDDYGTTTSRQSDRAPTGGAMDDDIPF